MILTLRRMQSRCETPIHQHNHIYHSQSGIVSLAPLIESCLASLDVLHSGDANHVQSMFLEVLVAVQVGGRQCALYLTQKTLPNQQLDYHFFLVAYDH